MTHRSHEKWTPEEECDLLSRFRAGTYPAEIARDLGRSELAIRSRLAKHDLLPLISAEVLAYLASLRATSSELLSKVEEVKSPVSNGKESTVPLDVQQAFHRFHFVYSLVNSRSHVYVGYSQDVWHRVGQHNRNVGAKATRNAGPWFPFSISCLAAEIDARALEREIHGNFGEFLRRSEVSLKEVLSQIGVPFELEKIVLVR
jgi:predicted GIY-YIG superfamily endonuclease